MQKIHKRLPQILGRYARRLKKKESTKGFTLVELIVVIVILAILAAILIPGMLKWIDQARDKKYELEAREIALAAEAAMAKVYAAGEEVTEVYNGHLQYKSTTGVVQNDYMKLDTFKQELEKLTGLPVENIKVIYPYGAGWNASEYSGQSRPWGGSISGFSIYFVASDGVNISAYYRSGPRVEFDGNTYNNPTDGWSITKNVTGSPFD